MKTNFHKTLLFAAAIMLAYTVNVQAQSTTASNSYTTTAYVGSSATSTFKDIVFKTNNTESMRILGTGTTIGNIGIGTATPLQKLHVVGNVLINGPTSALFFGEGATANPEWAIEYEPLPASGGLNFWKPFGSNGFGNYFLFLKDNGNVGIKTNTPMQTLDVNGAINVSQGVIQKGGSKITATSDLGLYSLTSGSWVRFVNTGGAFRFYSDGATNPIGNTPLFSIEGDGKTVIGNVSSPGNYKLYVEKGILTEKVKVAVATTSDWSDYVFNENYKLPSINELEAFVKANKHLPNVPSAEEVVKEGVDMAKMDAKLLEKIEELSLYIIELKKENIELKKGDMELAKRVERIESK